MLPVFQRSTLEEIQLHMVLECTRCADHSVASPNRSVPPPPLSSRRCGLNNQFAQPSKWLSAPVGKFGNHINDALRCFRIGSRSFLHEPSFLQEQVLSPRLVWLYNARHFPKGRANAA